MLKILQARLQQYMNCELPDIQAGFRKGRGSRDQIANIRWIWKSKGVPEKHLLLLYWLCQSLWLRGSQQTGKFLKVWEYQNTLLAFWETYMQFKKKQLEADMEKWTGCKLGKDYNQGCIFSPCLFTLYAKYIMQNSGLGEAQVEMKIAMRNINNLIYADDSTLWQKSKRNCRASWWKWKRRVKKLALSSRFRKLISWHLVPSLHGK